MAIIISKNGKGARKVEQATVDEEDYLQQYVSENPDSLPLSDIKEGAKLLVIGREFDTESGPIDVLAIDGDGDLYIIETKLYKNPDKRLVIAQMLDYGAALWKAYGDDDGFLGEIDALLSKSAAGGLGLRLRNVYGLSDSEVEDVREAIKRNLSDGNIKFAVLMDRLHDRLRDLILFINQKSRFNIYAVEMEFYENEGTEMVIPKLFGAEVKKDVSSGRAGRGKLFASDEEFLEAVETEPDKKIFRGLLSFADEIGATRHFRESCTTLRIPDPDESNRWITLFALNIDGYVHIGWTKSPGKWASEYAKSVAALFPGVAVMPKRSDTLSRSLTSEEIGRAFDKFTANVKSFVTKIKRASEGAAAGRR